jgi:hypothetical protein
MQLPNKRIQHTHTRNLTGQSTAAPKTVHIHTSMYIQTNLPESSDVKWGVGIASAQQHTKIELRKQKNPMHSQNWNLSHGPRPSPPQDLTGWDATGSQSSPSVIRPQVAPSAAFLLPGRQSTSECLSTSLPHTHVNSLPPPPLPVLRVRPIAARKKRARYSSSA